MNGKTLLEQGWPQSHILGLAKRAATAFEETYPQADALHFLDNVRTFPKAYLDSPLLGELARALVDDAERTNPPVERLRDENGAYRVWGAEGIDPAAIAQMDVAMRLPVTAAGALMPDAHVGYGLPIGGVLATWDVVIPFAVGSDIACRMRLSIYDDCQSRPNLEKALMTRTAFGTGCAWYGSDQAAHPVLDDPAWQQTALLRSLHPKAVEQLATSGSGNHFVEWGTLSLDDGSDLGIAPGTYLALMSHSGSRGVGFKIADTFSKLAESLHPTLPQEARKLSWLDMGGEAGQEYWLSMELAGRFASASHALIHRRVAAAVGLTEVASIENHHNYAWNEDGLIVHRKGATPAGPGVLGIIPGSMADPAYLVRGKGHPDSLSSASHGAGRAMGRRAALKAISKTDRADYLSARGVTLLGGGIDESPQAYKRIEQVMLAQSDLVETIGIFRPQIVRMADEPGDQ